MNEMLPHELEGFQRDLERAVERDLRRRRTARRARAAAAAVVAAGMVTAGAVLSFGGGAAQPLGVASADAAQRAAAALEVPRGTVLHVVTQARVNPGPETPIESWQDESWQLTTAPYSIRQIERRDGGVPAVESESDTGVERLYDPAKDTVYTLRLAPQPEIRVHLVSERPCVEALRWQEPDGVWQADNVDCATLKLALGRTWRAQRVGDTTATIRFVDKAGHQRAVRAATETVPPDAQGGRMNDPRAQALAMLRSKRLRPRGSAHVGRRAAIRLASSDGQVYLVDAKSYVPIEFRTPGAGGVTTRFVKYEVLPGTAANRGLLSIETQHPGAHVVEGADAYQAAERRLYPNG